MRKIYGVMMVLAVIFFIGTAGAVEHDDITLKRAAWQTVGSIVLFVAGWLLMTADDRKHGRCEWEQ